MLSIILCTLNYYYKYIKAVLFTLFSLIQLLLTAQELLKSATKAGYLLCARVGQADQRLQEVGARLVLRQINRTAQLQVAETVRVSVCFEGAVQWSRGVVAVEELQVGFRGETQVHVPS